MFTNINFAAYSLVGEPGSYLSKGNIGTYDFTYFHVLLLPLRFTLGELVTKNRSTTFKNTKKIYPEQ